MMFALPNISGNKRVLVNNFKATLCSQLPNYYDCPRPSWEENCR